MKTKKLVSILITLAMVVSLLPTMSLNVFAEEPAVTECYCLEVGAGAYIDTDVVPNENTRIVMDCEVKKEDTALFGTFLDWGYNNYNLFYVNSNKDFLGSGSGMNSQAWACSLLSGRRTIELAGKELKYGDTTVCTHNGAYASFGNHTAYLFAINFGSWVQTFENQRIRFYSCQIYKDGSIARDFVPAKKDNKSGLYDRTTRSFFEFKGDGAVIPYNKFIGNPQSVLPGGNEGVILDFDGTITVSQNTEINASPLQSGIAVAYGRNVTIDIKDGVTLKVTGGAAADTIGGGAGIEVPEGSSLTVSGLGTLDVTGGMAAIGGNGEKGDDGWVDSVTADCYSGKGGKGGDGGGGAGAGIGGRGGRGGLGGDGGDSVVGATAIAGLDGSAGLGGSAGEGCGNITVARTLKLTATGGAPCNTQAEGGHWGSDDWEPFHYTYFAFGGGGGGAGGSGYGGAKIGSGGYGGCGGGGGGSGSDEWFGQQYKIDGCVAYGLPGGGGSGFKNGKNGKDYYKETIYTDGYDPGNGGAGGNYGSVAEADRTGKEKAPEYCYTTAAVPQVVEKLIYNGEVQNGIINLSDLNDKYTLSGDVSATNVGTYSATVKLKDGCIWSDGTFADKKIEWSIAAHVISVPQAAASLEYNGKEQVGVPSDEGYDIYDNAKTNAGHYTAKAVLQYGYCWKGGSTEEKTIDWSIAEKKVPVPQATANYFTYNEKEHTCVSAGEGYDIFDNAKTNAGEYTAKAVLKDNYCWSDGTHNDKTFDWSIAKKTVTVPPETIYVHYSGAERYVLTDNDLYTVKNGTVPARYIGELYPSLTLRDANNYTWENRDEATINCVINVHKYSQGDNGCSVCGKAELFRYDVISYLDKKVTEDNTVVTEEKSCVDEIYITEEDKEWGIEELSTVWYVAKCDIELKYRPVVKGDVRIILVDGATLTANHGITVEGENSISIYAQSDENEMGKLIAETEGVTAIGGRNGGNGVDYYRGGNGGNGGNVNLYGGKIVLKNAGAACIGGGNGGNGEDSKKGGNGGNGGNVDLYGGEIVLKNAGAACIGGGNGGVGGESGDIGADDYIDGDGGNGGNSNLVNLYGGKISLESSNAVCIGGGNGGKGGNGVYAPPISSTGDGFSSIAAGNGGNGGSGSSVSIYGGEIFLKNPGGVCIGGGNGGNGGTEVIDGCGGNGGYSGKVCFDGGHTTLISENTAVIGGGKGGTGRERGGNGSIPEGFWNVSGLPVIKAGDNADNAGIIDKDNGYNNQPYLSVNYTVNELTLTLLDDNIFTVTPYGKDAGTGTIVVALYDSKDMFRLLDVKVFNDLSKPIEGTFTQSGIVKAYWWSDLDDIIPLCDAEPEKNLIFTAN